MPVERRPSCNNVRVKRCAETAILRYPEGRRDERCLRTRPRTRQYDKIKKIELDCPSINTLIILEIKLYRLCFADDLFNQKF